MKTKTKVASKKSEPTHKLTLKISVQWDKDDPHGPARAGEAVKKVLAAFVPPERLPEALAEIESAVDHLKPHDTLIVTADDGDQ